MKYYTQSNNEKNYKSSKALSILLMLLGIVFYVILITHDLRYSSLNSTSIYYNSNFFYDFRNLFSDLLLQIFGKTVYALPIILLIWSYKLFINEGIRFWKIKLLLLLLVLIISPALVYTIFDEYEAGLIGFFLVYYVEFLSQYATIFLIILAGIFLFVSSLGFKDIILLYLLGYKLFSKVLNLIINIYNLIKYKINPQQNIEEVNHKYDESILNIAPDLNFISQQAQINLDDEKFVSNLQDYEDNQNYFEEENKSHHKTKQKYYKNPKVKSYKKSGNSNGFLSFFNIFSKKKQQDKNLKKQVLKDRINNKVNNYSTEYENDNINAESYFTKTAKIKESRSNNSKLNDDSKLLRKKEQFLSGYNSQEISDSFSDQRHSYHNDSQNMQDSNSNHKTLRKHLSSNIHYEDEANHDNLGSYNNDVAYKKSSNIENHEDSISYANRGGDNNFKSSPRNASRSLQQDNSIKNISDLNNDYYQDIPEKEIAEPYGVSLDFLDIKRSGVGGITTREAKEFAAKLESIINEFGINGKIVSVKSGPVVTLYEISIPAGVKTSKLIALETDIALRMKAVSVRIAVVTGKDVIGIEIPNAKRKTIFLKEVFKRNEFQKTEATLPLALGYDIYGNAIIADLVTMPHLLIAGTTGSGKSVGVNSMILSMLYKLPPDQCKLIMIDPKMLELSVYQDIPHLLTPVVINPKEAITALKWVVKEMEFRYYQMSLLGVRNIKGFNEKIQNEEWLAKTKRKLLKEKSIELEFNYMPYIVVIIDEMADLMMVAGKEVESAVQRLAQMARASGIHLIMATQRPSADVITGTIKSNFPTRISFQVSSHIDSRIILGESGGERLLGRGDMLYMSGVGRIQRVHGPFVSDEEVQKVVSYLKSLGAPNYVNNVTSSLVLDGDLEEDRDELYEDAINLIQQEGKISTSFLQRKFQIGYNRAARIVEQLEAGGIVSKASNSGKREILIK